MPRRNDKGRDARKIDRERLERRLEQELEQIMAAVEERNPIIVHQRERRERRRAAA